ncbi:JmjC domain-containing protein [Nocardia sp. BMG51109]|uniref:JmjC domain-containing protein n=1 Tax=Nocardia sp. BMG51109 TaxID=1056816 RepID=UPI00046558D0|nr:cupin domain-containing protein [Nocardia sp. BMG51109]
MTVAEETVKTWPPSREFWSDRFRSETAGATVPVLFKHLVPTDVLGHAEVLAGLQRLRRAAADGDPSSARARVYVGEDRRDSLVDTVLGAPWNGDEPFVSWMQRLTGADRFSLVVNNLETTSPILSSVLGQLVESAFGGWGVPIGGCEQVAFAGNYAGTAFGVHEGYEDAFLVHLGPGVKHFYCWSGDLYRELTGSGAPTFGDYSWLLDHGQVFHLEPGDVLFLPRRVFHVGVQDEYSVSIAIAFYTYPDSRLLARSVLPTVLESVVVDDTPSPMYPIDGGPEPVAAALAIAASDMLETTERALPQHVYAQVTQRWQAVLSNGGWETVEHDLGRLDSAREAEAALAGGATRMRVRSPFRLYAIDGIDDALSIRITVRGITLSVPESPDWAAAISRLAAGETITLTDALHGDALWDLLRTGGIDVLTVTKEP